MDAATDSASQTDTAFFDSSQTSLFSVPTLYYDNLSLVSLHLDDDNNQVPPPWYGWVDLPVISLCLLNLAPLFRCLELAGYSTSTIEFGIAAADSSSQPPQGWIRVSLKAMAVDFSPVSLIQQEGLLPDPWTAADRFAVRLAVSRRVNTANAELSLPIESDDLQISYISFSSAIYPADYSSLTDALLDCNVIDLLHTLLVTIEARWLSFLDGDTLDPFLFSNPPGLLWMFDPAYWDSNPPQWDENGSAYLKNLASAVRDLISLDAYAFFALQIDLEGKLLAGEARLRALLEQAPGSQPPSSAPYLTLAFFQILRDRNQALGNPLSDYSFANIAGFMYEQYDSPVRYMELLMHLAQARLFPFPALPDPSQPNPFDFEEDPIEVHTTLDLNQVETGLEISVFESDPIRLTRIVDFGYPLDACVSWEYNEPDEYGKSRLVIVAAPGIAIENLQNFPATCQLVIYRVQNFQSLPAWGERIVDARFYGPSNQYALYVRDLQSYLDLTFDQEQQGETTPAPPGENLPPGDFSQPAFLVRKLESGVRITYPASAPDEDADFVLEINLDPTTAFDRYAVDIQPAETTGDKQRYAVIVFATLNVAISVSRHSSMISDLYWRVPLESMPSDGSPLSILPDELPAGAVPIANTDPFFSETYEPVPPGWVIFALDILIGFTPIGNAVDLIDLLQSFVTGNNKWGQPMTNWDRFGMLIGALMPFVSSGMITAMTKRASGAVEVLTKIEEMEIRLSRVETREAAGLTAAEVEELDNLKRTISDPHADPAAVANAIKASQALLENVAEKIAESAVRTTPRFGDIISAKGGVFSDERLLKWLMRWRKGRLKNNKLENAIDAWISRQAPGAPPKPVLDINNLEDYGEKLNRWIDDLCEWSSANRIDEAVPGSPLEYARGTRTGEPDTLLKEAIGEFYRSFLKGRTPDPRIPPLQYNRWPRLTDRLWPRAGSNAPQDLATVLTNRNYLVSKIKFVAAKVKTDVAFERFDPELTADFIERLVERYKKNGVFDATCVPDLIGKKPLSSEEFLDRVIAGIQMMADDMDTLGMSTYYDEMLTIPGLESYFEQVIRKSGYEHGYTFEVFVAARALFEDIAASDLWMQVYINGKMGPDIVRVMRDGFGNMVSGRIIQAKSFRSLSQLIGAGGKGEIQRQILSDLKRIAADSFKITGPNGEILPVDQLLQYKIDWARLRRSTYAIEGISDFHSLEAEAALNVRNLFYELYLKENVNAINTWLRSPEFRAEFKDLVADPTTMVPDFTLVVELVDQVLLESSARIF